MVKTKERKTSRKSSNGKMSVRAKTSRNGQARSASKKDSKTNPKRRGGASNNANAREMKFLERYKNNLSKTTLRAKWIHNPDEHEDRAGQTLATRDHEVIRHWAEERGAEPATVPTKDGGEPRVLRLNFPDYGGRTLEMLDWDRWFEVFDRRKLVFLFQERMKAGNQSNFFRLDSPEREEG